MCLCYAIYSNLGAKQSKNLPPPFTELLLNYFGGVLMPFGNFACLTIAIFSPFPEVLKQKTQTHGGPQDPTGLTLSTLPISAHSPLLWAHLTAATLCPLFCDTAKFFPASRPLHLLFPAFSYAQYLEGLWMCGQIAEPHRGLLGRQGSFQPMGSPRSRGRHG